MYIEKMLRTKTNISFTIYCEDSFALHHKLEFTHILKIDQFVGLVNLFTQSISGPYFSTEQQAQDFLNSEELLPYLTMLKLMGG